jgi:hypothetical protein
VFSCRQFSAKPDFDASKFGGWQNHCGTIALTSGGETGGADWGILLLMLVLVLNLKTGDDDDDEDGHEEDDGSPHLGNGSNNLALPGGWV